MINYRSFLEAKMCMARKSGFSVSESDINPMLKPHQRDIVRWALDGGRRGIFAAFGLGKSFMQLEAVRLIAAAYYVTAPCLEEETILRH